MFEMVKETHTFTATHLLPHWNNVSRQIETTSDSDDGGERVTYYAIHPDLGCGKNYSSREKAILAMLRDHGFTGVSL
jgi:hypothetical protein